MTPIHQYIPFLFPYLSAEDRTNLSVVNQDSLKAKIEFEEPYYKCLTEKMTKSEDHLSKEDLYISDIFGKIRQEWIISFLGRGMSKTAFSLDDNRVVLLPNYNSRTKFLWERMVKEEVFVSLYLQKQGLLTSFLQEVRVFVSPTDKTVAIPAYICTSFKHLANKENCFIIERDNSRGCTWKKGQHFLFDSLEKRLDVNNWISVLRPLWNDIVTLNHLPFVVNGDSLHIAIKRKNEPKEGENHYEIRYFGFDFSSKFDRLVKSNRPSRRYQLDTFSYLLRIILIHEFSKKDGLRYGQSPTLYEVDYEGLNYQEQDTLNQKICTLLQ